MSFFEGRANMTFFSKNAEKSPFLSFQNLWGKFWKLFRNLRLQISEKKLDGSKIQYFIEFTYNLILEYKIIGSKNYFFNFLLKK